MKGLGAGAGRKFLVRLPADIPTGVVYLELQHGSFVGGASPALVMPRERAAAAVELLQSLRTRDTLLKWSSLPSGRRSHSPLYCMSDRTCSSCAHVLMRWSMTSCRQPSGIAAAIA